jgi:hypothetical protein
MYKYPDSDFMQENQKLIHDGNLDFKSLSKLNITSDELKKPCANMELNILKM